MNKTSRDHKPLVQENFRGLYSRGLTDTVPNEFFTDCLNVKFNEGEVLTRDGLVSYLTKSNIVRYFTYRRLNETPRLIMLDSSGNLLDSLAPGTPIYTDASFADFSLINYNNRAYITPHNRVRGIPSKSLLVYEGTGSARLAAGLPPSGFTLTAANSSTSGSVEAGIHLFAVCNITSSGFITAPGPLVFAQLTATGGFKVDLSNIAVGGSEVVARIIVATKAIPTSLFSGNQFGYEFFFVPNGTINDNISTTISVSFYDSDLVDSADYLLDNLSTIPAGLGLAIYNGRLVSWAENGNEFTIRASEPSQPEVFNAVSGFITIDPSDAGSGIKNCSEHRKNLLVCTSNRIYNTADNGDDPSTWSVQVVDKSVGTECFGIANVLDARGTNNDRTWIATLPGLVCFEGLVRKPELSWNIEDVWKRINKAKFNLVQVADDPVNHRLFISVPLDSASAISHILYADYSKSFTVYGTIDEKALKWAVWSFPTAPVSISGEVDPVTFQPVFRLALAGGNIYDMKAALTDDFGNAIDSYVALALKQIVPGWVHHFGGIKLRVKGTGLLQITAYGEDGVGNTTYPSITLALNPGYEPDRLLNFINAKCSIKLRVNLFGEYFILSRYDLYAKELWLRRPQ